MRLKDRTTGKSKTIEAGFVFLGAGGGVLPLLQKSGIPKAKVTAASRFPVSGWSVKTFHR